MLKFRFRAQFGSRLAVVMLKSFNVLLNEEGLLENTAEREEEDAFALLEVPSASHFHVRICADLGPGLQLGFGIASLDGLTELRQGWRCTDRPEVWRSLYRKNCFLNLYVLGQKKSC